MATTLPRAPQPAHPTFYPNNTRASNSYAFATLQIQQHNHHNQTSPSHPWQTTANCTKSCLRCLILALTISFATISFIMIIAWFILKPKDPIFQVKSLSVLNFHPSKSTNYDIRLTVENPNRNIDLEFSPFNISMYYKMKPLSSALIPPFCLRKRNQTGSWVKSFPIKLGTNSRFNYHRDDMDREWSKGVVSFNVRMEGWAKFVAGDWLSKHRLMVVKCENLKVGFSPANVTGKLISEKKDCSIH